MGHPRRPRAPTAKITVSEQNITESEVRNSAHCMTAEAIKQAIPGAKSVSVDIQTIRWTDPAKPLRYIYLTPRSVQAAIIAFDRGEHIQPFAFKVATGQVVGAAAKRNTRKPSSPMPRDGSAEIHVENGGGTVPRIVGGKTPPRAPLSNTGGVGNRRAYGLRAFERMA